LVGINYSSFKEARYKKKCTCLQDLHIDLSDPTKVLVWHIGHLDSFLIYLINDNGQNMS